jgi:hypothetical protein
LNYTNIENYGQKINSALSPRLFLTKHNFQYKLHPNFKFSPFSATTKLAAAKSNIYTEKYQRNCFVIVESLFFLQKYSKSDMITTFDRIF